MARVRFWVDSGANITSRHKSRVLDTVEDLGLSESEWESMDDEERYKLVDDWAQEHISIGWEDIS